VALARFLDSRVGKTVSVLVEKDNRGHCEHYCPVQLTDASEAGTIVKAQISHVADGKLVGTIL